MKKKKAVVLALLLCLLCFFTSCNTSHYADPPVGTGPIKGTNTDTSSDEELEYIFRRELNAYYVSGIGTVRSSSVSVPESYKGYPVIGISESAFKECETIESITLSKNIITISTSAFAACKNLKSVNMLSNAVDIEDSAFYLCSSLSEISIPDKTEEIGQFAFGNCTSLKEIKFPSSLKSIGSGAFYACGFVSLEIPNGVTEIESETFSFCTALTNVKFHENLKSIGENAFVGCSSLTVINLPEGLEEIGSNAFASCIKLTTVIIPKGIKLIENNPFAYCRNLATISIGEGNSRYYTENNCFIDRKTKTLIHGLPGSVIPSDGSVTKIADFAFPSAAYTDGKISIPDTITEIGREAFYTKAGVCEQYENAYYIDGWLIQYDISGGLVFQTANTTTSKPSSSTGEKSFTAREGTKGISSQAFIFSLLEEITLPDGVEYISANAFSNATILSKVNLPSSIKNIGENAFTFCNSLKEIYFDGSIEEWNNITKENILSDKQITVICTDGEIKEGTR